MSFSNSGFLINPETYNWGKTIKPSYYKINLKHLSEEKFETLPQIKQYLKSELTISNLINELDYVEIEITHKEEIIKQLEEIISLQEMEIERLSSIVNWESKLNHKQLSKLNKWLN